jgi:hypothetical protein
MAASPSPTAGTASARPTSRESSGWCSMNQDNITADTLAEIWIGELCGSAVTTSSTCRTMPTTSLY